MGPDPASIMRQKLLDPQQWNMYSHVRNNPLGFLGPKGLYICGGTKEQCKSSEDARKRGLRSKDVNVHNAASAHGDAGQCNGVNVKFGDPW
jgi:hypothetical protein